MIQSAWSNIQKSLYFLTVIYKQKREAYPSQPITVTDFHNYKELLTNAFEF